MEPVKTLRHCLCPGLSLPHVVHRLCRPSCTWAGLSCSEMGFVLMSQPLFFPSLFRAPSKYRSFVHCIAQEALLPSSTVLQNVYLLLSSHYWGLVSFSVVWFSCFLSLKTETSVFSGQSLLGSCSAVGTGKGVLFSLALSRQSNF